MWKAGAILDFSVAYVILDFRLGSSETWIQGPTFGRPSSTYPTMEISAEFHAAKVYMYMHACIMPFKLDHS
jgi:hypothetical protein